MEDKILVKCGCGKRYRVPAERLGSTLECKHCGESFVAEQARDGRPGPTKAAAPDDTGSAIDPGRLMSHITGLKFSGTLIFSLVIHVILVGITSVAFVQLCISLGTTDPRAEIQRQQIERKEKEREESKKEYRAKLLAEQQERAAEKQAAKVAGPEGEKASAPSDRPKSPVEKRIEATSDERPKASDMSLDDDLDL